MNLTKKRWAILIAAILVNFCTGSVYSWSVFAGPLAEHLNELNGFAGAAALTASSIAIVYTLTNVCGPVSQIFSGAIYSKLGPRWITLIGGIFWGGGMILTSFVSSVPMLIVCFGLIGGVGNGLAYSCSVNNTIKFFPDHRGLVSGISTASYGLGSIVMSPVSNALIGSVGITNAFLYLGIIFLVIICLAAFLFQPCPADFVPDGYVPPATSANAVGEGKNWRGMLADRRFYVMFFLLLCGAFSGMMIISQASPVAQVMVGMDAAAAAAIVSLISVFNSGGRLICGFISDKLGRLNTLTVMLVVSVAGLALLYASGSGSVPLFCVGVCMIGLSFGAFMAIFPAFTVDQFGAKYNTLNYPIMMLGFALSSFLGPVMMSSLYESMGAYRPAFLVALGIVILGLILTFVFRAITRRKAAA